MTTTQTRFLTWQPDGRHETGIQWTHVPGFIGATWNPTTGCTRVSPGCDNCYAFALHDQRHIKNRDAARGVEFTPKEIAEIERYFPNLNHTQRVRLMEKVELPWAKQYDAPFSTVQVLDDFRLELPLRAKTRRAYFVDSMADLFHEDVDDLSLTRVFDVMEGAPEHIFMVLTKRPERMRDFLRRRRQNAEDYAVAWETHQLPERRTAPAAIAARQWADNPRSNIWLGVSAEDQQRADERIPLLLDTPAAVRFISAEPLLGSLDLTAIRHDDQFDKTGPQWLNALSGLTYFSDGDPGLRAPHLDWVIVGGESGPRSRPFDVAWALSLRDQCEAAGVAFFMKQLGAKPHLAPRGLEYGITYKGAPFTVPGAFVRMKHSHGSDMAEWSEDLRVREFPIEVA